ncbi:MAG: exo-alpha-sialidase [Thermoanaerobaculia bacterium]|nr:exo-alpha-sialidase [Thermoanaerobaculia bacterium]
MAEARRLSVETGDVVLFVGTRKGAFLFRSRGDDRDSFQMAGPWFQGEPVYSVAYDDRGGRRRLLAGSASWHWGPNLRYSDDFGTSWTDPEAIPIRFPEGSGLELKQIWQIEPGRDEDPGVLYAGVEPAALFESRDGGESWSLVRGLFDHPHRTEWQPGGGGLCLHTVLVDPEDSDRLWVAISTGGVYRSDDGGESWRPRNEGIRAEFLPEEHRYPEFGQCVHKIAAHPSRPERLFLQNHWGLYRSDDAGDTWEDVANGVPSDFGFPMEVHPHDPDTVYIVPLESDEFRCTPEARLRVYRTRDAGESWEPLTRGLPQENAYETILRDALCTDACEPAGVYFGTRSGKLFASSDGGDSWRALEDGLPPVLCLRAARIS